MILLLESLIFNSAEIVSTCSVHTPKLPTINSIIARQIGSGSPSPPLKGKEGKGGGGGLGEGIKIGDGTSTGGRGSTTGSWPPWGGRSSSSPFFFFFYITHGVYALGSLIGT